MSAQPSIGRADRRGTAANQSSFTTWSSPLVPARTSRCFRGLNERIGSCGGRRLVQPREYGFDDRLALSQGVSKGASVETIILANLPGACSVTSSHKTNDRNGTDWWVEIQGGHHLSVDAKVREEDWAAKPAPQKADDLALETWSVIERNKVGWTRDRTKRTD